MTKCHSASDRHRHGKRRGEAGLAGGGDGAAVGFDGAVDDAEAEAGAFDGAAVMLISPEEALEDEGQIVGGDAGAVVANFEDAFGFAPLAGEGDDEAGLQVLFEGVFDEVGEDLVPVKAVALEEAVFLGEIEHEACVPLFMHGGEVIDGVLHALADLEGLGIQGRGGVFEAGDAEHVLGEAGEALAVLLHGIEAAGEQGGGVPQGLDVAIDDGERGTQLVGGIGDEVPADLLGEGGLGDILHHEPGGADAGIQDGGGFDEEVATAEIGRGGGFAGEHLDLPGDPPLLLNGLLDEGGELVVTQLFDQTAAGVDAGALQHGGEWLIREEDAHLRIDDDDALADFIENGFEELVQSTLSGELIGGEAGGGDLLDEAVGFGVLDANGGDDIGEPFFMAVPLPPPGEPGEDQDEEKEEAEESCDPARIWS